MIMITDNIDDSDEKPKYKFVVVVSILRYWFERETSLLKTLVSVCFLNGLHVSTSVFHQAIYHFFS